MYLKSYFENYMILFDDFNDLYLSLFSLYKPLSEDWVIIAKTRIKNKILILIFIIYSCINYQIYKNY